MKALIVVLACSVIVGCESVRRDRDLARRSHSFEPRLVVAESKVPHREKREWDEIREQFARRAEYVFRDADRLSDTTVRVSLELKADRYRGIQLWFELKDGRWIENVSRAEEVEYLIP